jgi:hypothetical protein
MYIKPFHLRTDNRVRKLQLELKQPKARALRQKSWRTAQAFQLSVFER